MPDPEVELTGGLPPVVTGDADEEDEEPDEEDDEDAEGPVGEPLRRGSLRRMALEPRPAREGDESEQREQGAADDHEPRIAAANGGQRLHLFTLDAWFRC